MPPMENKHPSVILLVALLGSALVGCGIEEASDLGYTARSKPSPVADSESCRLAVTLDHPLAGQPGMRALRHAARQSGTVDTLEQLGWGYITLARDGEGSAALFLAGQTADCMLAKDADSLQGQLLRANYLHQVHDFTGAEAVASQLVERRGGWFDYAVLGDALTEQGRLEAAADAYQDMVDLKPGAEAYGRIAHLNRLSGDIEGAMEMMVMAIRAQDIRDRRAAAWWRAGLADYLLEAGQPEEALAVIDRSLSFHAENHKSHFLRARVLMSLGRHDEAIQSLESALALNALPEYRRTLSEWRKSIDRPSPVSGSQSYLPNA